jgi:hypothetical protein
LIYIRKNPMDEKHFMTSSNNNDVFLPTNIGSFQLQVVV